MSDKDRAKYLFENCWYWVKPDEANYIESMVDSLQIIISVPDMKRIMQERAFAIQRNEAAIEFLHNIEGYPNRASFVTESIREILEGKS